MNIFLKSFRIIIYSIPLVLILNVYNAQAYTDTSQLAGEKNLSEKLKAVNSTKESNFSQLYNENLIFHKDVFDWKFYVTAYDDLKNFNETQAKKHWKDHGLYEKRKAVQNFDARTYMLHNPALTNFFGWNPDSTEHFPAAMMHYILFGKYFRKNGVAKGDAQISNNILTLTTTARDAGAVASILFQGKEFINDYDHGRQLQVAWSLNGKGECFNPTEAGTEADALNLTSSSYVHKLLSTPTSLSTWTSPAFWLSSQYPTEYSKQSCHNNEPNTLGIPGNGKTTNTTVLSNQMLHKTISLNFQNDPYIIEYKGSITFPDAMEKVQIEVPTGYLTGEFDECYWFEENKLKFIPTEERGPPSGAWAWGCSSPNSYVPVVMATKDKNYAMGVYMVSSQNPIYSVVYYKGASISDATGKWSVILRRENTPAESTIDFASYIVVGDVETVEAKMKYLADYFHDIPVSSVLTDDSVFNWQYYIDHNPGLKYVGLHSVDNQACASGGTAAYDQTKCRPRTREEAIRHWKEYGLVEGREAVENFKVSEYREMYPNKALEEKYKIDSNMRNLLFGYVNDYVLHKNEVRPGRFAFHPDVFDLNYYLSQYEDIRNLKKNTNNSDNAVRQHWLYSGVQEGRRASEKYNPVDYISTLPEESRTYLNALKIYFTKNTPILERAT